MRTKKVFSSPQSCSHCPRSTSPSFCYLIGKKKFFSSYQQYRCPCSSVLYFNGASQWPTHTRRIGLWLTEPPKFRKPMDFLQSHEHFRVTRYSPEEICSAALEYADHEEIGHTFQFAPFVPARWFAGRFVLWRFLKRLTLKKIALFTYLWYGLKKEIS